MNPLESLESIDKLFFNIVKTQTKALFQPSRNRVTIRVGHRLL